MTTIERKRTVNNRPPPFPQDFGERLERLKELTGLSWGEVRRATRRDAARPGEVAQWRAAFGTLPVAPSSSWPARFRAVTT